MKNRLRNNKQAQVDSDKEVKLATISEEGKNQREKARLAANVKLAELANITQQHNQRINLDIEKERTKQAEERRKEAEEKRKEAEEKRKEAEEKTKHLAEEVKLESAKQERMKAEANACLEELHTCRKKRK